MTNAAQERIALVIGNANYQHYAPLDNPLNDANDLTADLSDLGFSVTLAVDASLDTTIDLVEQFGNQLRDSDAVGLFYYAGHAIQVDGENYLVPIDARLEQSSRVPFETYRINSALGAMRGRAQGAINLIILDACRNNPFPTSTRGASRGLARVAAPESTLILYATQPGQTASDNTAGRNGLFTKHLRKAIQRAGVDVEQGFSEVVRAVYRESGGRQYPWKEGVLLKEFAFRQTPSAVDEDIGLSANQPKQQNNSNDNNKQNTASTHCPGELTPSSPLACLFTEQPGRELPIHGTDNIDCPSPLTNQSAIQCLFNQ